MMFLVLLFVSVFLEAGDMGKAHQEGVKLAHAQKGDVANKVKSMNNVDVPGYKTDHPSEMNLSQNSLKDEALVKKHNDDAAHYIQKNSSDPNRKKHDIETEDFFVNAEKATKEPLKTMNEIVMEEQGSDLENNETFDCEESGEPYQASCSRWLEVILNVQHTKEHHYRCTLGHHKDDDPSCQAREDYFFSKKKVAFIRDEWKTNCGTLDALSEKGFCVYGKKETGGQETRIIQGESVTRPSWSERYTYLCKKEVSIDKSCDALRAKRCRQVDSKCLEFLNNVCVLWRYTYQCAPTTKKITTYHSNDKNSPFCFTGNCADSTYPVNTDIMDAFSHLAILKQVQEDNKNNLGIFKGNGCHCSKNFLNFKDCCGGNGGWGVDIGLSRCGQDEKELIEQRKKGLCIDLGEYCAERFLGACIRRKRGFCCFGSKLSKTVQEQGRSQLGLTFGSSEHPDCRALTVEELSKLDFSKMDLTPLYEDISQKMKVPDQGHMAKGIELDRIRDNMNMLTHNKNRKQ